MPGDGGTGLLNILAAQGYSAANGWNISRFDIQGSISLGTYLAYVEQAPTLQQGTLNPFTPQATPGGGGAEIGLGYSPGPGDPSGAGHALNNAHWLQIVITNSPSKDAIGITFDGNTYYIDNQGNKANSPFYDDIPGAFGFTANATDIIDAPVRGYSSSTFWYAETFIATGDLNAKVLQISNQAIQWGFYDPVTAVPEPSTLVLFLSGVVCIFMSLLHRNIRRNIMPICVSFTASRA